MDRGQILEAAFEIQVSMMQMWKQCFAVTLQKEGLTYAQMAVLMCIRERQPVMSKEVAKHLRQTPSSISQIIDGLTSAKFIMRDPDLSDRRVVRLRLSETGQQIVGRLRAKRKELFYQSTKSLTDSELQADLEFQQKALDQLRAYVTRQQL